MDVSVIIVNYNTTLLLTNCLKSIYDKTIDLEFEVIIVDNNSSDRSFTNLKDIYSNILIIENAENLGFGVANNIGISRASGRYLFLLNSDTLLLNNAIKCLHDFLELKQNEDIFLCGGSLYKSNLSNQVSYGNFPSLTQVLFNFGFDRIFSRYYQENYSTACFCNHVKPFKVDYVCGADLFIRRSLIKSSQIFDEKYFMFFEETEFQFRFTSKFNAKIFIVPNAKIVHFGSGSFNEMKYKYFEQSQIYFFESRYNKILSTLIKFLLIIQYSLNFIIFKDRKHWKLKLSGLLKY
jgi:hypothetical protein